MPILKKGRIQSRGFYSMKMLPGRKLQVNFFWQVKKLENVTIYEYTVMTDIIEENGRCVGIFAENEEGKMRIYAP